MGAKWAKNEVTATKRRCDMIIQKVDGSLAPRESDFAGAGLIFISGVSSPDFVLALGGMRNKRRALVVEDITIENYDPELERLTVTNHGLQYGDGPLVPTSTAGGFVSGNQYWVIAHSDNEFSLAASLEDAYGGVKVNVLVDDDLIGMVFQDTPTTQRGLDGHFVYEATQAETDHDAPETIVIVDEAAEYPRSSGAGGYTTVMMESSAADEGAVELEAGITRDDARRIILRTHAAKFNVVGNVETFRDMADTKDSHHGTVTTAGRIDAGVDDPT